MITTITYPPLIPYGIFKVAMPSKDTFNYLLLFNISSGEVVWANASYIDKGDGKDLINSTVYDQLHQIRKKH